MDEHERSCLLALARRTLAGCLDLPVSDSPEPADFSSIRHNGAFVTLKRKGVDPKDGAALRGCIGYMTDAMPLDRMVARLAEEAAFRDPRFPPVQRSELAGLVIEISVLTPLQPIASFDLIRPGIDGVVLSHSGHRAVFLPQVAIEQQWSVDTMLDNLALKAGLPFDAWHEKACRLEVFQAEVFSEDR